MDKSMDEKLAEFKKFLESYLQFAKRYDYSSYHEGREDALISVLTEFEIIFEKDNEDERLPVWRSYVY